MWGYPDVLKKMWKYGVQRARVQRGFLGCKHGVHMGDSLNEPMTYHMHLWHTK